MRKKYLVLSAFLLLGIGVRSQSHDPSPVRLVNAGCMAVASNGDATALYVPYSVLMKDHDPINSRVSILQEGVTSIGGSFYQESNSNVFSLGVDGWGTSTGTIVFSGDALSGDRFIRTRDAADMENFERASRFVAFPHIKIGTDDNIHIPGRMGIDAASVTYREGTEEGVFYLHSDLDDIGKKVFDASLRISAVGVDNAARTSEELVAAGSVIIERDISIYRSSTTSPLFPFATPMKNQRAGYFAGNFVRKFLEDPAYAGHTEYVLGNKDANSDGWIDGDQYVKAAYEILTPGKGYLIKPRPAGYDYSQLPFDQTYGLAPGAYDKGIFIFNGKVYNLGDAVKQVFAEDELFRKELSGQTYDKTVNLIIGNSYTSALSIDKIYDALVNTGLSVSSTIYIYPAGSTSYIPYSFSSPEPINAVEFSDIPSMTYFMLRLSKNKPQNGSFVIDRSMQTHGKLSNNFRSSRQYNNELVFRVSPEDNNNVYDLAMIALRDKTTGAQSKVSNPQKDAFQLYAGNTMSIAVEPEGTTVVPLGFVPSEGVSGYNISVSRVESMATEAVLLEDRKTGIWIDLRQTSEYVFEATAGDPEGRFYVHFAEKVVTGIDEILQSPLTVYYNNGKIKINGLVTADIGAPIRINDIQGHTIINTQVNNHPQEMLHANLRAGVYLVYIGGERNQTVKVLVKGGAQ